MYKTTKTIASSLLAMTAFLTPVYAAEEPMSPAQLQEAAANLVIGDATRFTINSAAENIQFVIVSGGNFSLKSDSLTIQPSPPLQDGQYGFEISAITGQKTVSGTDNGRDGSVQTNDVISVVQTGYFIIKDGAVLDLAGET